jgi:acetyl-CoA synthetase
MTYPYQLTSFDAYKEAYKKSIEDPAAFWADVANHFTWRKKWDTALEWNFKEPKVEWFKGGTLNITENCLDRHIPTKGHLPAMIWEPNAPDEAGRVLTYSKLLEKVCPVSYTHLRAHETLS